MALNEYSNKPSTFKQDKDFPIKVILEYERGSIQFPVNPETLKEVISSQSVTENIESLGEISIPQRPSLSEMTFNSFFWHEVDKVPPENYIRWLKNWQKSRKPAKLTVSNLKWFNMEVTCESFSHWVNAGEEGDIYFEITLKEYKRFKAVKINVSTSGVLTESTYEKLMGNIEPEQGENVAPVWFNVGRPARSDVNKLPTPSIIETRNDDSILSITRLKVGDSSKWEELYDVNKETLGEIVEDEIITSDIPLETPKSWNPDKFVVPTLDINTALKKSKTMATIFKKFDQMKTIFNDLKTMLEDFEQSEGAMQEFINYLEDMYSIFQPDNLLSPIESAKHVLEDMMAIADFPEEAVGSVNQLIEILMSIALDIDDFVSEW